MGAFFFFTLVVVAGWPAAVLPAFLRAAATLLPCAPMAAAPASVRQCKGAGGYLELDAAPLAHTARCAPRRFADVDSHGRPTFLLRAAVTPSCYAFGIA